MKVYALLIERMIDMEGFMPEIPLISDNPEQIKALFKKVTDTERECAKEAQWTVDTDTEDTFMAYEPYYYNSNHILVKIIEQELNKTVTP